MTYVHLNLLLAAWQDRYGGFIKGVAVLILVEHGNIHRLGLLFLEGEDDVGIGAVRTHGSRLAGSVVQLVIGGHLTYVHLHFLLAAVRNRHRGLIERAAIFILVEHRNVRVGHRRRFQGRRRGRLLCGGGQRRRNAGGDIQHNGGGHLIALRVKGIDIFRVLRIKVAGILHVSQRQIADPLTRIILIAVMIRVGNRKRHTGKRFAAGDLRPEYAVPIGG